MAKLDLDIILIDESVVGHGFRALMSGADLSDFIKNPIMLFMHARPDGKNKEVKLPIGKWCDIRIEGDKLLAKPEFDDDDPEALRIQKKVEKGYLNAASIWILPLEVSDQNSLKLQGQTAPTITRWNLNEASIVDIPNCRNAVAIRSSPGASIVLNGSEGDTAITDYLNSLLPNTTTMDTKALALKLGAEASATETALLATLDTLIASGANATLLATENTALKDEIVKLKSEKLSTEIEAIVGGAIEKGKILATEADGYKKLALTNLDTVKALLNAKPVYESIEQKLAAGGKAGGGAEHASLMAKSGADLYESGELERLKELDLPGFKLKYKEAFGVEFA